MNSETFVWDDDGSDNDLDKQGDRFEPEYSVEFLQRKSEFELQLSSVTPVAEAAAVSRLTSTWWCSCRKCRQMCVCVCGGQSHQKQS